MKKKFYLTIVMAFITLFSFAQVLDLGDFENGQLGAWGSWGAPVAVVANPNTAGNSSAFCGSLDQSGGAWNGFRIWNDVSILSPTYTKLTLDVYLSASGLIQLYLDNSAGGSANYTKQVSNIPANTWTSIEFDLTLLPAMDYKQIAFQSNIQGVILFDNIKMIGIPANSEKKVIARETFGTTAFDTNGPAKTDGFATHFKASEITGFTSTNGSIMGGSDNSVRLNNYDNTLAKPAYWRDPSGGMQAHMAIRDGDSYKGSWDTLYYNNIDISESFWVTAIEFGYARARTLGTEDHRSLNVAYRVDGGEWMQLDTSKIIPANVFSKWDYIVLPVNITGQKLDIRFACIQANEQIYLDDLTVEALVPDYELTEDIVTRETFGTTAFDTNGPAKTDGFATHFKASEITGFTSTNGSIIGGSDNSVRLNNYDNTLAKPGYWRDPSGGMQAHMAIRDGDSYKGSWDTLVYSNIDISAAFAVSAIEFGYARARTLGTENHRSLNVEYSVDGSAWMQLDTSLIVPANVFSKWDYIVMPVNIKGNKLDIRFACIQTNEQIYLDDLTVIGKVQAPEGVNDFVVENVIVGAVDSPEDYTCNLNLKWDESMVTLLLTIVDDSIVSTGTAYQVDNIEVYFDMDNSKNIHWPRNGGWISNDPTYDANDFQFRLVPGVEFSVNNSFKGATQVYTETAVGYNFELTIPWDSLMDGFVPANGVQIGFDILASDNDATASDANRNQVTLFSKIDKPFNDPSLFGTLQFESKGTFKIIPDEEAPGKVSNLTATTDKKTATLAWDNATDNIAVLYYNVYQNGTALANKVYPKQSANTLKISALEDGDYTFELEAVDNSFNVSASKASVNVKIVTTSVDEVSSGILVYPNPVSGMLNIKSASMVKQVEIINLSGSVLRKEAGTSIDVSSLNKGVYLLKVLTDNETFTTRFLKD